MSSVRRAVPRLPAEEPGQPELAELRLASSLLRRAVARTIAAVSLSIEERAQCENLAARSPAFSGEPSRVGPRDRARARRA